MIQKGKGGGGARPLVHRSVKSSPCHPPPCVSGPASLAFTHRDSRHSCRSLVAERHSCLHKLFQGQTNVENGTCCHIETEVADQTCHLTQSQCSDNGPDSPNPDPIWPEVGQCS